MNELIIDAHVHLPVYGNLLTLEDKRRQLLQDMKKDFERITEKKIRLDNLMKFYNGGILEN